MRGGLVGWQSAFGGPGELPLGIYTTIILVLKLLGVMVVLILVGAYSTYVERKILAFMQDRLGPTRVGYKGLLQPIADGLKLIQKECIVPLGADKVFHYWAPILVFIPSMMGAVIIPFGEGLIPFDLSMGVLYLFAIGAIGVMGIFLAAHGSDNKYSSFGGFRAVGQLISYEVPLAFSMMTVVLLAGDIRVGGIIDAQLKGGGLGFPIWFIVPQFLGFLIFFIANVAETNRVPFDLPEAESELVSGFHTEFTGIRFAFFFLAEYVNIFIASSMITTLFLGGYGGFDLPFLGQTLSSVVWFALKVFLLFFAIVWLRGTLPRLRIDQLMELCWKRLVPLAMINFFVTGIIKLANEIRLNPNLLWPILEKGWGTALLFFILFFVGMVVWVRHLLKGVFGKPALERRA
ncbi:NADH-quinone oxidoreductase subunit NuoH [bacterium]|nr:NADH-quinone oxidoreductase subunit NuoH [bacterium]